jgi:transcriptional regulator with XRE-family HTH domain
MTGTDLQKLRLQLGLTQDELSQRLGVARVTVARWEIGLRHIAEPMSRLIQLIAKEVQGEKKKRKA